MNGDTSSFFCFCPKDPQSKALKLTAGFSGVQSVKLMGDKDQIEVTGDVDAVDLNTKLRKKVGFAEIVSVSEDKKKEEEKENTDDTKEVPPVIWPCPQREIVYLGDPYPGPGCCPM
ncbi:uncharacterized protein LOC130139152 [Syzygium oleosum]|uniref:uncharacterized protein LOC130139152 n=1 Tax=Syzygium oleosum TaxID=219896 RepID=UPI0024BA8F53|nr:uncharacterized protein LOC130139152 [Syzygium oleosum]